MKKYLFILLLAISAFTLRAQEYPKYQFSFGWGGYPAYELFYYENPFAIYDRDIPHQYMYPDLRNIYRDYPAPMYSTGTFSGEFAINFKKWFTLSFDLAANVQWRNYFDAVSRDRNGTEAGFMIHILPNARFNWLNRDMVRMYSSIGLGVMTGTDAETQEFLIWPSAQLNPAGIEVGRKVFGFCELGIGTMFSGAMFGIGYRF